MTQAEEPSAPWIHIGECPLCVNGLCRLRYCEDDHGAAHLFAMCDECEALWIEPNTDSEKSFPAAVHPACPICGQDLYGLQAHWSLPQELTGTVWQDNAIFEVPSDVGLPIVDGDEPLGELASPSAFDPTSREEVDSPGLGTEDMSYGQDDPKPGC